MSTLAEQMEKASSFSLRYQRIMEAAGISTDAELARLLGIAAPSVTGVKRRESLPMGWLEKIATTFGVSTDWLLYGVGPKFVRHSGIAEGNRGGEAGRDTHFSLATPKTEKVVLVGDSDEKGSIQEVSRPEVDMLFIPLAEARLSAGTGSLETGGDKERVYGFRSDFLFRKGNPRAMVLMRVSGNSMEPEIKHGDMVLLDQSKTDILPGRMYAVGFEEAIYIKKIDMAPGKVILKSENPDYPPFECDVRGDNAELFRVIGRVMWVGREY